MSVLPIITPQCRVRPPSTSIMPPVPPPTPSPTPLPPPLATIFTEAMEKYQKKTKKNLASHPLAARLDSCGDVSAIRAVLRAQAQVLDRSQSVDEKLTKWLDPIVNVLCALSDTIGNAVGLVTTPKFKPARDLLSDVCDSGIPTCDHNIFRDRSPSTSECRP